MEILSIERYIKASHQVLDEILFGVPKVAKENDEKAKRNLMIEMGLDSKVEYDKKQFNKVEEEVIGYYQGTSTKQNIYMLVKVLTVIKQHGN